MQNDKNRWNSYLYIHTYSFHSVTISDFDCLPGAMYNKHALIVCRWMDVQQRTWV